MQQTKSMVHAYIISRIDQNNRFLIAIPDLISKIQKVKNTAAKVIFKTKKYDHVTGLLKELHWQLMSQLIILLLNFVLHDEGPTYLKYFIQLH